MTTVRDQHELRIRSESAYWRAAHVLQIRALNYIHSDNVALTKPPVQSTYAVDVVLDYGNEQDPMMKDLVALFSQDEMGEPGTQEKLKRLQAKLRELDPSLSVDLKNRLMQPESRNWALVVSWDVNPSV
jgi:hypothetical protein